MAASPAVKETEVAAWEPPTSDQEFVFKDIASAPAWVDKAWASWNMGPALAVPHGDIWDNNKPYTTTSARPGDTVKFVANKGSMPAHFEVIPGTPDPAKGGITKAVPQQSAATLEDLLKNGYLTPADLSETDKAKVAERGPMFKALIEEGKGAPKKQDIKQQFV